MVDCVSVSVDCVCVCVDCVCVSMDVWCTFNTTSHSIHSTFRLLHTTFTDYFTQHSQTTSHNIHSTLRLALFPGLHAQLLSLAVACKSWAWRPENEATLRPLSCENCTLNVVLSSLECTVNSSIVICVFSYLYNCTKEVYNIK